MNTAEFHRNIWLEFSKLKVILAPILLILSVFVVHSMSQFSGQHSVYSMSKVISVLHTYLFFCSSIWGLKKSIDSITDEIGQNTLFFQKNLPYPPLEFMLSKISGATSYTWYCYILGVIALLLHLILVPIDINPVNNSTSFFIKVILMSLLHGFLMQYLSHFITKLFFLNYENKHKVKASSLLILNFIISAWTGLIVYGSLTKKFVTMNSFFGIALAESSIIIVYLTYFAIFSIIAVFHCYKIVFKYQTSKIAWLVFLLLTPIISFGPYYNSMKVESYVFMNIFAIGLMCYFSFLVKKWSIIDFKKIKQIKKIELFNLPYFVYPLISFLFFVICIIPFVMHSPDDNNLNLILVLLVGFLFIIRDLILFVHMSVNNMVKSKRVFFCVILVFAYGLMPFILNIAWEGSNAILIPHKDHILLSFISVILQIGVLAQFIKKNLKIDQI